MLNTEGSVPKFLLKICWEMLHINERKTIASECFIKNETIKANLNEITQLNNFWKTAFPNL